MLDSVTVDEFRARAEKSGIGDQTMINKALKHYLNGFNEQPLTESALRRVLKKELPQLSQ